MSLTCSSQYAAGTVHLLKEGGTDPLLHKMSRSYGNQGREQAVFPVGPVTTSHGGTYRCYDAPSTQPYLWSRPSDPLHLQVTGEAPRPLYFLDRPLTSALCPMSPGGDVGGGAGTLGSWGRTGRKPREGAGQALSAALGAGRACSHMPPCPVRRPVQGTLPLRPAQLARARRRQPDPPVSLRGQLSQLRSDQGRGAQPAPPSRRAAEPRLPSGPCEPRPRGPVQMLQRTQLLRVVGPQRPPGHPDRR